LATHRSGRSGNWLKIEYRADREIVIGGWTTEGGTVRSLAGVIAPSSSLRRPRRHRLRARSRKVALPNLQTLTRETSPFEGANSPSKERTFAG
jgi:hypothetical protein